MNLPRVLLIATVLCLIASTVEHVRCDDGEAGMATLRPSVRMRSVCQQCQKLLLLDMQG